jgi:hypothetical protein
MYTDIIHVPAESQRMQYMSEIVKELKQVET